MVHNRVLGLLSCWMQRCGFDTPPGKIFLVKIFPLELTWVQTPFPLSDESINRGLVCAHMHFIAQTQKILTSCPRRVNAGNKNTPSLHHPQRQNVTTSMVGLKTVTYAKFSLKMVNPRGVTQSKKKKRQKKKKQKRESSAPPEDLSYGPVVRCWGL